MEEKIKYYLTLIQQNKLVEIEYNSQIYFAQTTEEISAPNKSHNYILLLPEINDVLKHAASPAPEIFDTADDTLFSIENAIGIPDYALKENGSIDCIVTKNKLLYALMKRIRSGLILWPS